MRRILMSSEGEFSNPKKVSRSRNLAVKKLASFYDGVAGKTNTSEEKVVVSNSSCKIKLKS